MADNYPDIETPLGRAWLRAASIEQSLLSHSSIECDPVLREHVQQLAHAVKVLAEYVERLESHHHTHGLHDPHCNLRR